MAHHHDDVPDAGLAELADLPLHEHLAAHLEGGLGALEGQRRQARAGTGRENHGVAHAVGLEGGETVRGGGTIGGEEAVGAEGARGLVDRAHRDAAGRRNGTLGAGAVERRVLEHGELVAGEGARGQGSLLKVRADAVRADVHDNMNITYR